MEFALCRIYTKFYISQILNAISYYEMKSNQLEFQKLIDEHMTDESAMDLDESKTESQLTRSGVTSKVTTKNYTSERQSLATINEDSRYKRYFVYEGVVYSKVEIQGMVVEVQIKGTEDKNNLRYILYIDDTTGVIQTIAWRNKNSNLFQKIESDIVNFDQLLEMRQIYKNYWPNRLFFEHF